MSAIETTRYYYLMFLSYDHDSDEVVRRVAVGPVYEPGFELDDYNMAAALMVYRMEHPRSYDYIKRVAQIRLHEKEVRLAPILIPVRVFNAFYQTMEQFRQAVPYSFTDFSPD